VTPKNAIAFVQSHGLVLESARGSVPNMAEAVAGERIQGRWWSHPRGHVRSLKGRAQARVQECKIQTIGSTCSWAATPIWTRGCAAQNEQVCKSSPLHGPLSRDANRCQSCTWQPLGVTGELGGADKGATADWPALAGETTSWGASCGRAHLFSGNR